MNIDPVTGDITNLTEAECRAVLKQNRTAKAQIAAAWFTARGVPPGIGDNHWLKNFAEQFILNTKLANAVMDYIRDNGVPSNANPPVQE